MAARRALAALAAVAVTVPLAATPAGAHGAPTSPLSRAAACGPEGGGRARTPACRAAIAAGAAVREWDNIRVARVDGRDRERIPDGELCSGGLSAYRGLDLPRADWPATTLTAGARHTFRYRTTIPHQGTFRFYVTTGSYSPQRRLTWADLEKKPFLQVTDPPIRSGAYEMRGRLPADRTGRHIVYVIWQNSDTQDTYYSCSDVIFRAARGEPDATPAAPEASASPPRTLAGAATDDEPAVPVATVTDGGPLSRPLVLGAAALVVALLAAAVVGRRLSRAGGPPPGRPCGVRNHRAGRRRVW
ncbi:MULTISPECIES: lytic polysaccharide monooxygenase [Micromonospora]|uniref:lytic polysaccharide monooxygenase auxiliary activity family 9 protein n=1 Tax=Micromonospora TaxID=1873 RepID=UPI00112AA54E|nr:MULTISPECIES: lytic polysaccharide monooxygenase [unclassified Micromonospora]MBP1781125.1 chitin-binding protein [Micromonospora sp. HB375]MBQ1061553.1 lytic polysaccharide monooxygenase [Micromonospora sp. C41]MCK1806166.1 lytic polysaccharide monooxygenase [Micromonospora sp. R42106]MCK1830288.1 lytic polysaccharide monooxygenase [Micromonospora sp. R42003]MCK1845920.1 lytic polysaccharide monooxygenase [Micromonospora sp. R42004]